MLKEQLPLEDSLAINANSSVEDFLEHLGELLAKEYIQLMEQASLEVESIEKLEI